MRRGPALLTGAALWVLTAAIAASCAGGARTGEDTREGPAGPSPGASVTVSVPRALIEAVETRAAVPRGTLVGPGTGGDGTKVPFVVLAYDNTGDFGPGTPGTSTAGWQEALDHCVANVLDLYVKGGYGGTRPIYHVSDTIRFPPAQDFRVDGGVYVVNWTGPRRDDLMLIDSCMNCEIHLGILVYGGHGAGLRIRPVAPVPIDGFPIVVETEIHSQGIADPHPFTPGERSGGTGLVFDGTRAPIVHSTFLFFGVLNFSTVIETTGNFANNQLDVLHLHTNAHKSTLLELGEGAVANSLRLGIGVDQGASDVTGVVLAGRSNALELMPRPSNEPFPDGRMLILDRSAQGNQINVLSQEPFEPLASVTDRARTPTNQITWTGGPGSITEVRAERGRFIYTQRLYPATVRVVGGDVSSIELVRGAERVDCSGAGEAGILMSVGDTLEIESKDPPVLQVVPVKVR